MAALTDEIRQQILAYLPRYPSKQAVTLPALHLVHDALRCVSYDAIREIADILDQVYREADDTDAVEIGGSGRNASRGRRAQGAPGRAVSAGVFEGRDTASMPRAELADLIKDLTEQMMAAARDLQFELAARFRDEIADLKKELRGMDAAGLK